MKKNHQYRKLFKHSRASALDNRVLPDKINLIYKQIPLAIVAQFFVAFFVLIAMSGSIKPFYLNYWFVYMTTVSIAWIILPIVYRLQNNLLSFQQWLGVLGFFIFLSGSGWGYAGYFLMLKGQYIYQTFISIILFGLTAGAMPFLAPVLFTYMLFLLPALLPYTVWLLMQPSEIHSILGICSIIYIIVMFGSSYYSHKFLTASLTLRYKNSDLGSINQLLEKKVAERTRLLNKSLSITRASIESTADGILVVDLNGKPELYNQNFLNMWDLPQDFIKQIDSVAMIKKLKSELTAAKEFIHSLFQSLTDFETDFYGEIRFKNDRVFEWHSKPNKANDAPLGRVWSFRDITTRKDIENQLSYQATHDTLTGLPNKNLLYDRIDQGITYSKRFHSNLIVYFLDIDNFKLINDNLGHDIGDMLLKKIASRLKNCVRESDTVARFGGDEFVILFLTNDITKVHQLSRALLEETHKPVRIKDYNLVVTCSIGASTYPKDGKDAATLLKNADIAMYHAKDQGKNNFKSYCLDINPHPKHLFEMQGELYNALLKREFVLFYQPIVHLKTGEIMAAEALVRWQHPEKGLLMPADFIPYAETSGFIVQMGKWIFKEACVQNKLWQRAGLKPIKIAINIAAPQLMDEQFENYVQRTIEKTGLDPSYIELELTESLLMDHSKHIIQTMKRLKQLGIRIVIDDFGIGYSSLNYLRQFPVDKLKIDGSFVQQLPDNKDDASIIKAFIAMGKGLKLHLVAEGIEQDNQLKFLIKNGCQEGQGYLFSPALKPTQFARLLSNGTIDVSKIKTA